MSSENENLFSHFEQRFDQFGHKELIHTDDGRSLTWREVDEISAQMASTLRDTGAVPGDRVSVQVQKSPENLCLYLACLRAGLVYHPLNMAYTATELEYFLGDAEPGIVICDTGREREIVGIADGNTCVLTLDGDGNGTLSDLSSNNPNRFETAHRAATDMAALLYSSGTTGGAEGHHAHARQPAQQQRGAGQGLGLHQR